MCLIRLQSEQVSHVIVLIWLYMVSQWTYQRCLWHQANRVCAQLVKLEVCLSLMHHESRSVQPSVYCLAGLPSLIWSSNFLSLCIWYFFMNRLLATKAFNLWSVMGVITLDQPHCCHSLLPVISTCKKNQSMFTLWVQFNNFDHFNTI